MELEGRGFRDEGLIALALEGAIPGSARFIAKQDLFNGPDNQAVHEVAKANTITAICVLTQTSLLNTDNAHLLPLALEAKTKGQLRAAIEATYLLLTRHGVAV